MTLKKLKTVMPSLKPNVPSVLRSGLVYKISCPHCKVCYVGQTSRHLLTRFREHKSRTGGPIKNHFTECVNQPVTLDDIEILAFTSKSEKHFLTLEALYIREEKPYLNTQKC